MSILTVSNWSLYAGIVSFARSVSLEKVLYRSVLDCCHCCVNLCLTPNFISKMNKSDRQKRREAFKKLPYAEKIARTEANERKKQLLLYKREQTLKKLNHYSKCQALDLNGQNLHISEILLEINAKELAETFVQAEWKRHREIEWKDAKTAKNLLIWT